MREIFENELKKVGFDLVGFSDCDFTLLKPYLIEAEQKKWSSPLIKGEINERLNAKLVLPEAEGIVVVGLTYSKDSPLIAANELHFGNSSWGRDYHLVLKEKCNQALVEIIKKHPNIKYQIITDTSILDDRFLAYKAGLGFYGKNSLIINEQLGSYFFIGAIVTNIKFTNDSLVTNKCGNCIKCMVACPGRAINESGILNSYLCRSYLTQKKEELTLKEQKKLGLSVFGCDICARVCPYNEKINHVKNKEFLPIGLEQINEELEISNKEFKKRYGHLAGAYIGKSRINRNIRYIKDKNNVL